MSRYATASQAHYPSGEAAVASGHAEALAVLGVWLELGDYAAGGGLGELLRALADERVRYSSDVLKPALAQLPLDSIVKSAPRLQLLTPKALSLLSALLV